MTQRFSITLPDDLSDRLRVAAPDNVSQYVAEAVQDRLDRAMWEQSKQADELLGINDDWIRQQVKLREQAREQALR